MAPHSQLQHELLHSHKLHSRRCKWNNGFISIRDSRDNNLWTKYSDILLGTNYKEKLKVWQMDESWVNRWNDPYIKNEFAYGEQPNDYLKGQLEKN
jgi:hypothetical protein